MIDEQGTDGRQGPAPASSTMATRAAPAARGGASREAIAHAFLAEYHRLLAAALPEPVAAPPSDSGSVVRRQAFAWRVTAARIPLVPDRCWPAWLLEHLRAAAASPGLGPEYRRQRELLLTLLGDPGVGESPIA